MSSIYLPRFSIKRELVRTQSPFLRVTLWLKAGTVINHESLDHDVAIVLYTDVTIDLNAFVTDSVAMIGIVGLRHSWCPGNYILIDLPNVYVGGDCDVSRVGSPFEIVIVVLFCSLQKPLWSIIDFLSDSCTPICIYCNCQWFSKSLDSNYGGLPCSYSKSSLPRLFYLIASSNWLDRKGILAGFVKLVATFDLVIVPMWRSERTEIRELLVEFCVGLWSIFGVENCEKTKLSRKN